VWTSFGVTSTGPVDVLGVETASLTTVVVAEGPLYAVFLAYSYALLFTGIIILFEFVVRYDQLYTKQVVMVVMGVLVPLFGSVLNEFRVTAVGHLPIAAFMLTVSAVAFANAMFRHGLFETVPATRRIGRASVIEGMRDAVVVTDTQNRIVDLNPTATALFGITLRESLGESVREHVPVDLDPDSETFDATVRETVHEVTVSPLADQHGRTVGQAFVFRDVTEHRHDRQRLSVLNRVLRHNLRTEINALGGYARQLEREGRYDSEIVSRIVEASDELATLGRKAREVERVMDESAEAERLDLGRLIADATASLTRTRPGITVESRLDGDYVVREDPAVLTAILVDLFDALARHNDSLEPTITVEAAAADGSVVVVIEDDGSGIPAEEYTVVEAGDETPLDHASGLSLWLVKWGVARIGARISFDQPRPGAVSLELDGHGEAGTGGDEAGVAAE